nr:family 1 glycosylhydrolase [Novosphingobium pokkalii]
MPSTGPIACRQLGQQALRSATSVNLIIYISMICYNSRSMDRLSSTCFDRNLISFAREAPYQLARPISQQCPAWPIGTIILVRHICGISQWRINAVAACNARKMGNNSGVLGRSHAAAWPDQPARWGDICVMGERARHRHFDRQPARRPDPCGAAPLRQAMASGVPLLGYIHWSLLDNFEWIFGYKPQFGLVSVDRQTFKRSLKPSALVLSRIARANGVPADLG